MGLFTIKIWTCKNREKKIKNHIFIYVMHGMDVEKYANMYNNHTPIPSFCSSLSKKERKKRKS